MLTTSNYLNMYTNQETCWDCGLHTRAVDRRERQCSWRIIHSRNLRFLCDPCAIFEVLSS